MPAPLEQLTWTMLGAKSINRQSTINQLIADHTSSGSRLGALKSLLCSKNSRSNPPSGVLFISFADFLTVSCVHADEKQTNN